MWKEKTIAFCEGVMCVEWAYQQISLFLSFFPSFEFIPNKSNDRAVDNIDMTSEYIGMYITIKQVSDDEDKRMVSNKPVQSSPGRNTSKKGQIMETMVMRLLVKQERRSKWPPRGWL